MEKKPFKIPSECKKLILFFWDLKHYACEELKENNIQTEPAQTSFDDLQKICHNNPDGPLAKYVRELQKCFQMNPDELREYNRKIKVREEPAKQDDAFELDNDTALDFGVPEDSDMTGISEDLDFDLEEFDED